MIKKSVPEKIDSILTKVLSQKGYLNACREADVVSKWSLIVGEHFASHAQCTRVDNGVLFVKVPSSSWRNEISFLKDTILKAIKEKTDCRSIHNVVFY